MEFLPIFLDVRGKPCLVVGGGEVARRKVENLLRANASVRVVAPTLCGGLREYATAGEIAYREGHFQIQDLDDVHLVVSATDDPEVNRLVSREAQARRLPVNVVDQPDLCSYVTPSIVDRSPLVIAISTGGAAPVLARQLRARIETLIPYGYRGLAALSARFRERVKAKLTESNQRRNFWERVFSGSLVDRLLSVTESEAERLLEQELLASGDEAGRGEVYLIGGGPGDPDLLTFRALRLMQSADVVVYDRLVAKPVLDLVRRDAERVYVGKERGNHVMRQEEINRLLARLAKQGKKVARLKGGDPFIFGRGGEEIDTLASEGITFQVVPGITAASGCAAYGGIPLTHRDYAQSVTFVTGHLKDGTINLNWRQLAEPNQTLVFYMGLHGLPILCERLVAHGVPETMPAALVEQGTTEKQHVYVGTLSTLPDIVERHRPSPPTLIIVGEVVRLHDKLAWYHAPASSELGATTPIEPGSGLLSETV